MTQFKTLKWCYTHDRECKEYRMYEPEDGLMITWIHLTGDKDLLGVQLINGQHDVMRANTKIQIEKIKRT